MTDSLARARADLEAGRAWKARDRLLGLLAHRQDDEVLDLLATVHHEMRDLPRAGALWFVTGRDDDPARAAVAAWRERHGDDGERWRSLPGVVREPERGLHLQALHEAATRARIPAVRPHVAEVKEHWWEPIACGGLILVVFLGVVAMIGIGTWTVLQWIWS